MPERSSQSLPLRRHLEVAFGVFMTFVIEPKQPSPSRRWVRQAAVTFLVFALSLVTGRAVERYADQTYLGDTIKNVEYSILQHALLTQFVSTSSLVRDDSRLPTVIDISPIPFDRTKPTDRSMLDALIDQLEKMHAAAIGVDIDFSPDETGAFMDPKRDPKLFLKWNHYGNVRLGVFRREGDSSNQWLGHAAFRNLAAGIMLPATNSMYAYQYSSPDLATASEPAPGLAAWANDPDQYLLQMPAALYEILHEGPRQRLVDDPHLKTDAGVDGRLKLGQYPIDYSYLRDIRPIPYRGPQDLARYEQEIESRTVLIGDTRDTQDARSIPIGSDPVSGVMIHAAAFATMNHGLLRYIEGWWSFGFESGLGFLAWFVMCVVFFLNDSPTRSRRFSTHAVEIMSSFAAGVAVLLASTTFISITKFFWPGFLWITAGFFIHPCLHYVHHLVIKPGLRGAVQHAESA